MKTDHFPDIATIDIGNQHVSVAWNNDFVIETSLSSTDNLFNSLSIPSHLPLLISCVLEKSKIEEKYPQFHRWMAKHSGPCFYVNDFRSEFQFLSMPVQYAATLGEDRLVVAYGAYEKYLKHSANQNASDFGIIFDAGTMLTIDFISKTEGFMGGYILPGIFPYKNSLGQGNRLNNYSLFQNIPQIPQLPLDTKSAMELGYVESVLALVEKKIQSLQSKNSKNGFLLFTGGDSQFWLKLVSQNLNEQQMIFMENKRFIHESLSLLPYKEKK